MAAFGKAEGPAAGWGGDAALLLARLLLGAALCVGGAERVGLGSGHCLRDPAPACEAEERSLCGDDADCGRLVPARCRDARVAACKDAGAAAAGHLEAGALLGEPSWTLPGPGRLWLLGLGAAGCVAGALLALGVAARAAAAIALPGLTIALALLASRGLDAALAWPQQPALLQAALALTILAFGAGRLRMPALSAAKGGAGKAARGAGSGAAVVKGAPRAAKA